MWNNRSLQEATDNIWTDDTANESALESSGRTAPPRGIYLPPPTRPLIIPNSEAHLPPPIRPLVIPSVEVWRPPPNPYQPLAPLVYPYATTPELDQIIDISSSNDSSYNTVNRIIDISSSNDSSYNTIHQRLGHRSGGTSRRGNPWAGAAPARVEAYQQGNVYDGHRARFGSPLIHISDCNTSHGEQFRSFEDRVQEPCGDRDEDEMDACSRLSHNRRSITSRNSSSSIRPHPYRLQYRIALDQESGPSGHQGGRKNPSCAFRILQDNPDREGSNRDNSRVGSTTLLHGPPTSNSRSSYESSERTVTNNLNSGGHDICRTNNSRSSSNTFSGEQTSKSVNDNAKQHPREISYEADDEASYSRGRSWGRPRRSPMVTASYKGSNAPTSHSSCMSNSKAIQESASSSPWFAHKSLQGSKEPSTHGSNSKGSQENDSRYWSLSPEEASDNYVSATSADPNYVSATSADPNYVSETSVDPNYVSETSADPNYVSETSIDATNDASGSTHPQVTYIIESERSRNANHSNHSAMSNPHSYEESRHNPRDRAQP